MFKHQYIAERVDRRTYLKGRFKGKFTGKMDRSSSDPLRERYYDLEITEGEIETRQDHLVPWMEKKEPHEFVADTVFPTRLPGKINVTLHYLNGEVKHFKIALKQIKLKDCHLSGQMYANNQVYGTIEGLISGYVLHHDMLVKEIAEEPPVPKPDRKDPESRPGETTGKPRRGGESSETSLSHERTHFLKIIGGLIGVGLLVAGLLILKHWILTLLGVLGSGFLIGWLKRWSERRYGLKTSLNITTILVILVFISFAFYLAFNYHDFAYTRTGKTKPLSATGIKDLKRKAADFLAKNYYQDALELYNQLLKIEVNDPFLHYQRALCYAGLERITEAVEDLRLLISKGDTSAIILHDQINPIKKRQIGTVIRCNDGTISHSKNRKGTCSGHGGVKHWDEPVLEEYREY